VPAVSHVKTVAEFATKIGAAWHRSFDGVIEAGRLWAEAKDTLSRTELAELKATTRFSDAAVSKLISISEDSRITDPRYRAVLPNSYGTLYELTHLGDSEFEAAAQEGALRPDIQRDDVLALRGKQPSSQAKAKKALLVSSSAKHDEIEAPDLKALKSAMLSIIDLPSLLIELSPAYERLMKKAG
jgi:hypothetical protein